MKAQFWNTMYRVIAALSLTLMLSACGGGGGGTLPAATSSTATGKVALDVTDAPGLEYNNAWITVTGVWFHTSADAGTADPTGWRRFDLPAPVTLDLAKLANGVMYGDTNGGRSLFEGLNLPVGSYQQIRLFLASTEDTLTASAAAAGLKYNNQINYLDGTGTLQSAPLRIPAAVVGIRVVPETPIQVTNGGSIRLGLDFDLSHDVVKTDREGLLEFILKPRLGYYDMSKVGAIKGTIAFKNTSSFNFIIKAEQPNAAGTFRIVKRFTSIKPNGDFVIYPLQANGRPYDILIRGRNAETVIIRGVPVVSGSTPADRVTSLGSAIPVPVGTEYTMNLFGRPTGAWVNFYQTLTAADIPYEVRYRHLDPVSGRFFENMQLSRGPLHVADYNTVTGQAGPFQTVTPVGGNGAFAAVADALYFSRSAAIPLSALNDGMTLGTPAAPVFTLPVDTAMATPRAVSGRIMMGPGAPNMDKGYVFAVHGGLILDRVDASAQMGMSGASYPAFTLPGNRPDAFFGLFALGWNSTSPNLARAFGIGQIVDLRNATADVTNADIAMLLFLNRN